MSSIASLGFAVNQDYLFEGINWNPCLEEYEVWMAGEVVAWTDDPDTATRSYREEVGAYNDHLSRTYRLPCGCSVVGDEFCRHQWEAELEAADDEA